MAKYGIDLY
jgi:hypothetical protein